MDTQGFVNLSPSARDSQAVVWLRLLADPRFGAGRLHSVELTTRPEFASELDTIADIDGWKVAQLLAWGKLEHCQDPRVGRREQHDGTAVYDSSWGHLEHTHLGEHPIRQDGTPMLD